MSQQSRQTGAPEYEEHTLAEQSSQSDHVSIWGFPSALKHPRCGIAHENDSDWSSQNHGSLLTRRSSCDCAAHTHTHM